MSYKYFIKKIHAHDFKMDNSQKSQPTNFDEQFWTDLGMKYEAAFGHDTGLHNIVQEYIHMLPASATVLDCGSGTGKPVAKAISESGHHVHGIDMSSGMITLSRKAVPNGTFEVANMHPQSPTTAL